MMNSLQTPSPPKEARTNSLLTGKKLEDARRMRKRLTKDLPTADLNEISGYITDELQRLKYHPDTTRHDHYTVHKHAFDQIVENKAVVFKSILSNLKAEYEDCIKALEKGQSQAVYLQGMVKALLVEKSTLRQFVRRGDELDEKIEKLRTQNQNLASRVRDLRSRRIKRKSSAENKSMRSISRDTRVIIPGLTLEELTDITTLRRTLYRLESQVSEMEEASTTKFAVKSQKAVLKEKLTVKEVAVGHVSEQYKRTKERCEVLKVAVEAAKSALDNPSQDIHMSKVVMKALKDYGAWEDNPSNNVLHQLINFDEDDPIKKKEAERLIEYCDHFNNLFDFGQYDAAAIHAANSPYGILRNYETMIRFKQAEPQDPDINPLLILCDALMATASAGQPLTQAMSVECIRCALNTNRLDLATHWLAQGKLSYSIPLGDIINNHCKCPQEKCTCTCVPLAETVYMNVAAHHRVARCLCRQQKFVTLLQYTKKHGQFTKADYQTLLKKCPSAELALLMLTTKGSKKTSWILSFASVVSTLLETGHSEVLLEVLKRMSNGEGNRDLSSLINKVLFEETSQDHMSSDKWLEVVNICQTAEMYDAAIELLAALTIRDALNKASIAFTMDYIS